jgi:hypothetical protein
MGTRRIVPVSPGNVRDTAVPDYPTLKHIKLLHVHARKLSERCEYSGNCSLKDLNERVKRVQKSSLFLHLDFKKFGLTAPRGLTNIFLEELGKGHLKIPRCFLINDEEVLETSRGGGALGWLDPLFQLVVTAIILSFVKKHKIKGFDFIGFMDDFEIGFYRKREEEAEVIRDLLIRELESWGFFISYNKTYISKMSIFLENYHGERNYGLSMNKHQLAVQSFAKSLCAEFSFKAKIYYAEGSKYIKSSRIRDMCMNSIKPIFEEEFSKPVMLGGWLWPVDYRGGLDLSLEQASLKDLEFISLISRYKEPHLMPKFVDVKLDTIVRRKKKLIQSSYKRTLEKGALSFDETPPLSQDEIDRLSMLAAGGAPTPQAVFSGRNTGFRENEVDPG